MLDANVFIDAKNRYYGFNLCPGYWTALIAHHERGRIFSIDKVRNELTTTRNELDDAPDVLSDWAKDSVPDTFFKGTQDQAVVDVFREMVIWVNSEAQFTPAAKDEFAKKADGWVIAYAKANGLIVVTHEAYEPESKKKVKMPNVCLEFDVEYVNTFEMLEELRVKFILQTKRQRRK